MEGCVDALVGIYLLYFFDNMFIAYCMYGASYSCGDDNVVVGFHPWACIAFIGGGVCLRLY